MKYYTIANIILRQSPKKSSAQIALIPEGSRCEVLSYEPMTGDGLEWYNTVWRGHNGWAYASGLEPYSLEGVSPNLVDVGLSTSEGWDPEQFIVYEGRRLTNACGEFCVCFIGRQKIGQFMKMWKAKDSATYSRIVPNNKVTGLDVLESMVSVYGFPTERFGPSMADPILGFVVSPGKIQKRIAAGWLLIAGVSIGGVSGILNEGGIGHWVVLNYIQPARCKSGLVNIWNPFWQELERYSYREFDRSMKTMNYAGLWVKPDLLERV